MCDKDERLYLLFYMYTVYRLSHLGVDMLITSVYCIRAFQKNYKFQNTR